MRVTVVHQARSSQPLTAAFQLGQMMPRPKLRRQSSKLVQPSPSKHFLRLSKIVLHSPLFSSKQVFPAPSSIVFALPNSILNCPQILTRDIYTPLPPSRHLILNYICLARHALFSLL